ncbi:hypothetical protein BDZ90DRAFT_234391 [Jaminaea rosea]|uniref:Uncharacterized protein n=1 Tax=Jaminaea rosea TaxID=1569628 RepID=A0A316ULD1_9BASI|nr:hypothetical protein BDZ90DRAFT_234391 [Jaminaea rosea]PWN25191.1 hypothetical protein BDZ90DRAFT_234391 [Jaminaea rosea]
MTLVEGDDMHRLWSLIVDLSAQLNMNRQQITSLQSQLQTLKAHSVHSNTGFALRRFNVDVSKETFESELERLNVHLAQENNDLRWENKMNDRLIKEYEQCLDMVMRKFRAFSHATQTHTLKLTQYYEDLLSSNTHDVAAVSLHAQTSLSQTLSNLGSLVRNALREVEGEAPSPPPTIGGHDDEDDAGANVGEGSSATASSSSRKRQQSSQQAQQLWPGSGGYTGKAGDLAAQRSDAALEREAELQMLRYENETLKEILDMSEGKGLDVGAGKDKLSLGTPRGGGSGGSVSGGVGAAGRVKVRTPSMHQPGGAAGQMQLPGIGIGQLYPPPQQQSQGGDSQQSTGYTARPPPSLSTADIPAAPFPSSISAPLSHPVPPPTPPSPSSTGGGAGVARIPLHERMQQAAEAIRSQAQQQQRDNAPSASSSASPYIVPDRGATTQVSLPSSSLSSATTTTSAEAAPTTAVATESETLVPAPVESASAQSDVRGAPLLSLVESTAETPATSSAAEDMAEEPEISPADVGAVEPLKHEETAEGESAGQTEGQVAPDADTATGASNAAGAADEEAPAEHDVDLSDPVTKTEAETEEDVAAPITEPTDEEAESVPAAATETTAASSSPSSDGSASTVATEASAGEDGAAVEPETKETAGSADAVGGEGEGKGEEE